MHIFTSFLRLLFIHKAYRILYATQVISSELCPCFCLIAKWRKWWKLDTIASYGFFVIMATLETLLQSRNPGGAVGNWYRYGKLWNSDPYTAPDSRMCQQTLSFGIKFQYPTWYPTKIMKWKLIGNPQAHIRLYSYIQTAKEQACPLWTS
jgi:hypothetical protein